MLHSTALSEIAARFGTPCYAYFPDVAIERVRLIRDVFSSLVGVSFAVKANPNRALLDLLRPEVQHLDVSSGGEILLGLDAGFAPGDFTFVGPAKADWELDLALEKGCGQIVVESVGEMQRLNGLAAKRGARPRVVLRINPESVPKGYGVAMSMRSTQFGIDEEKVDEAISALGSLEHLDFYGFHIYAGTQCLKNDSIVANFENCARIFLSFSERHDLRPGNLIFGSGFGIPYHDKDQPIDLGYIAEQTRPIFDRLRGDARTGGAEINLELGRYVIGEAGYFLASVLSTKTSRGTHIAMLDGGMNQHLAASGNLGGVLKRNYPVFRVSPLCEGDAEMAWDLAGNLCTNVDSLGRGVQLGPLEPGDLVGIASSGAYGLTSSPVHFISHRPPLEILATETGGGFTYADITASGIIARPPAWPAL